jgi:predicted DNA-binding ribbon-helix-helix protein
MSRLKRSLVAKRSIAMEGRKTSVSLEPQFWNALRSIANARGMTMGDLVAAIKTDRQSGNLSSAIRVFVLNLYSAQIEREGRGRAAH